MTAPSPTLGGDLLRTLRTRARHHVTGQPLTRADVEAQSVGAGNLQRYEAGRIRQPQRATLEAVLDAIDALAARGVRFSERAEVLRHFGYATGAPLPTDDEKAWARRATAPTLAALPFPAYVRDQSGTLVHLNAPFARAHGASVGGWFAERLRTMPFWHAYFAPEVRLADRILNADAFVPASLRAVQLELRPYHHEPWHRRLVDEARAASPAFRLLWDRLAADDDPPEVPARPLTVLALRPPPPLAAAGLTRLAFRPASEPLVRDRRFRVVYLLPADAPTLDVFGPG